MQLTKRLHFRDHSPTPTPNSTRGEERKRLLLFQSPPPLPAAEIVHYRGGTKTKQHQDAHQNTISPHRFKACPAAEPHRAFEAHTRWCASPCATIAPTKTPSWSGIHQTPHPLTPVQYVTCRRFLRAGIVLKRPQLTRHTVPTT